nr:MAG TPA: LPS-assembly protein [Bacteriophage sp.]
MRFLFCAHYLDEEVISSFFLTSCGFDSRWALPLSDVNRQNSSTGRKTGRSFEL